MKKIISLLIIGFFVGLMCQSCAPSASGPVAMFYHNTTSKYNAYFLARERMAELELELLKSDKNNYNRMLNIYPKVDCTFAKSSKERLDKIIKTASIPIQWHKPSHWLDDCYLIIGKCRYYDYDRENAINTFRYIYNKYKDDEIKHQAVSQLIHTYMDMNDYQSASEWISKLVDAPMSPKNLAAFSLANGQYHIHEGEYEKAYEKLKVGAKFIKPRWYRLKIMYLLGQIAEKANNKKAALANYDKARRRNIDYEMSFNAILKTYLMRDYKVEEDYLKTYKFYKKSLKDIKNIDYKDKIYYDWATIEQNRPDLDVAVDKYKLSIKSSNKNQFVKSFSYLRIAEIFYDTQKFEPSKYYYDSAVAILEKDLPEFPKALKRQKILKEFVEQLKIVRKEDSLQKLAKMPAADLSNFIDKWIKDEDKKQIEASKAAEKLAKQLEGRDTSSVANAKPAEANEKWYFYNPALVQLGVLDFTRKWGARPNEDNWRREAREKELQETTANAVLDANAPKKDSVKKEAPSVDQRKKQFLDRIPTDPVKFDTSVAILKRALFKLGRIYDFNLEEYKNAKKIYTRYYTEFPDDDRAAEALYAIYLICLNKALDEDCVNETKKILLEKYPNSLYANLVLDPDYLQKNKIKGEKVKAQYRLAFEAYENGKYLLSQSLCDSTLKYYPKSDFQDRMIILKAMITGQTQSMNNYQTALKTFMTDYPKSKLKEYADNLLKMAEKVAKADSSGRLQNRITWDLDINFPHYFCVISKDLTKISELKSKFDSYNTNFFTDEKYKTSEIKLDSVTSVLAIEMFVNKIQAMNYWEKQKGKSSPISQYPDINFDYFVISDKNFAIMNNEKSYKGYKEFFNKNY